MSPLDWLVLVLWAASGVETGVEVRRKRWGAAAFSALIFVLLTLIGWRIFVYLARVVASWF